MYAIRYIVLLSIHSCCMLKNKLSCKGCPSVCCLSYIICGNIYGFSCNNYTPLWRLGVLFYPCVSVCLSICLSVIPETCGWRVIFHSLPSVVCICFVLLHIMFENKSLTFMFDDSILLHWKKCKKFDTFIATEYQGEAIKLYVHICQTSSAKYFELRKGLRRI